MFSIIILAALTAVLITAIITVAAEPLTERNSPCGRFFRAIRIRLREISRTSFCVITILLLLFGLIIGVSDFTDIWIAVLILFALLFVLHPNDILDLKKRRKKAKLKKLMPMLPKSAVKCKPAGIARELPELPELTPICSDTEANPSDTIE